MAGKKEAKQKAGPRGQTEKNREETEGSTGTKNTSEEGGQRTAQSMQRKTPQRKEAQKDLKGQGESKKPGLTKRRQARKVATMVKRLKKNPEDVEQQSLAEAGASLTPEGGWDAQQQATVAAYAQSRGMQPPEVLQALVSSMEKTLRKEKGENLASQTSSLGVKQREEAAGKIEARPNPGRGGRDLRERKTDSNCVACCKDKKRGVPRKPDGKKNRKKRPETKRHKAKRIGPWRYLNQEEPSLQRGQREVKLSRPREKPRRVQQRCLDQEEPPPQPGWREAKPNRPRKKPRRVRRIRRRKTPKHRWHV